MKSHVRDHRMGVFNVNVGWGYHHLFCIFWGIPPICICIFQGISSSVLLLSMHHLDDHLADPEHIPVRQHPSLPPMAPPKQFWGLGRWACSFWGLDLELLPTSKLTDITDMKTNHD